MGYTPEFFTQQQPGALRSAESVIPLVLSYIQPRSVIDVGCGTGAWLAEFQKQGVPDILGLDGEQVPQDMLLIPSESFQTADLTESIQIEKKYDLVVSLEVAEHLPSDKATTFIQSLTSLGSVILFSAAIPFQGGQDHFNEQWPRYWETLFKQFGFVGIDCLRPTLWSDDSIEWWYRQNIFFFVELERLNHYPSLEQFYAPQASLLNVVHPERYMALLSHLGQTLKHLHGVEGRLLELEKAVKHIESSEQSSSEHTSIYNPQEDPFKNPPKEF